MATANQVLTALAGKVVTATTGLSSLLTAVGWPPANLIQDTAKGAYSVCGVFDRGVTVNTQRWPRITACNDVNVAPGVSVVSFTGASPLETTATLTLSGTPTINDTCVVQVGNGVGVVGEAVTSAVAGYKAVLGDTLSTFATALAGQISLITGLSASASSGVITITSSLPPTYLQANIANQGTRTTEYTRIARHIAIVFFCPNEPTRQQLTDPVESMLAQLRSFYGFTLANGEWVRVLYERDLYSDDHQLQNVYRRDFFLECEYGITGTEPVYPVLGDVFSVTLEGN